MKKIFVLLFSAVLIMSMTACGRVEKETKTTDATAATTSTVTANTDTEPSDLPTATDSTAATETTAAEQPTTVPTEKNETTGTTCAHRNVQQATCLLPAKCLDCNATLGEALGHHYVDKACTRCGKKNPDYTARVEVIGVRLDQTEAELLIGETVTLAATLTPTNATDKAVAWKSSNPAIATVSADGTVKALAIGETTITASSLNGKTATCRVSVRDMVVELPEFPQEVIYNASYNKVAIYVLLSGADYTFTQTSQNAGTLLLMFDGKLSYAGDGAGGYTYPNFGWRLYNDADVVVEEGIAKSDEALAIGSSLVGLTVEIPSIRFGRYRLELYNTYKAK